MRKNLFFFQESTAMSLKIRLPLKNGNHDEKGGIFVWKMGVVAQGNLFFVQPYEAVTSYTETISYGRRDKLVCLAMPLLFIYVFSVDGRDSA